MVLIFSISIVVAIITLTHTVTNPCKSCGDEVKMLIRNPAYPILKAPGSFMNNENTSADNGDVRMKLKRSVIEEENLGTTVSGFKFTGKDTRLRSYLNYKNINA